MHHKIAFLLIIIILVSTTSCDSLFDKEDSKPKQPQITGFATGLTAPLGLETDTKEQLWVTEAGTGQANDGQLSLVTPQGSVVPVITGFPITGFPSSVSPEGAVFGLNHIILQDKIFWMLHGVEGKLYKFDISTFKAGDASLQASELEYENIGTFVKNYAFADDTNETDIFNLTIGPDGDLFIVDAAANAISRRKATTGQLSVFATIPSVNNPAGNPAQVEVVPTGIVFDGQKFLVCSFTGFPFPAKNAPIYQVDLNGNTTVYQTGLSNLADIELDQDQQPVVVEYGSWTGQTFAEDSGTIISATPEKVTPLVTGLNFPNSIERTSPNT